MSEHKPIRKPLYFSTTMRNPRRIADFLNCLIPYENKILTHELIIQIIGDLIKLRFYKPTIIREINNLRVIYNDEDNVFTQEQIDFIISNSPQRHKEAGYDAGWDSRFDTFFKLAMELGFVNYAMGKQIKISSPGHMLVDALKEQEPNEEKISAVFLNALVKYQSNNPYRKNANTNIPLILLLQVLDLLKNDNHENGAGVFRQELSLFICWPDNNAVALYKKIKQIRAEKGFSYSDEYIYEICLGLLQANEKQRDRFKMSQICDEYIDEYIRKMRSTGIISLRGNGRFIDLNSLELKKINYILKKYPSIKNFKDRYDYYTYMGKVDPFLLNIPDYSTSETTKVKKSALLKFAQEYSRQTVYDELQKLCNKRGSSDQLLKLLPEPVRLEFLTSLALIQNLPNVEVLPNYTVDDEGLPINTAGGGKADIVCKSSNCQSLVEVTLMRDRSNQLANEIIPIRRHLLSEMQKYENVFSIFIAPRIHEDAIEMILWYKHKDKIDICAYTIPDFISVIKKLPQLKDISSFFWKNYENSN